MQITPKRHNRDRQDLSTRAVNEILIRDFLNMNDEIQEDTARGVEEYLIERINQQGWAGRLGTPDADNS